MTAIKPKLNFDVAQSKFRDAVLDALDEAAADVFSEYIPPWQATQAGADDGDLPELFKTIDDHLVKLAERFGVMWRD